MKTSAKSHVSTGRLITNTKSKSIAAVRRFLALAVVAILLCVSSSSYSGKRSQSEQHRRDDGRTIIIFENNKEIAGSVTSPSPSSQTVDVSVGPGFSFSPDTVDILVGDTVRWTWANSNHTVTSGSPCTPDSAYCSINNTNCTSAPSSNKDTVYTHTFTQAGTYPYFCRIHCGSGMTGTVNVAAPFVNITSVARLANEHFVITGRTLPNLTVRIEFSPDLIQAFGELTPPAIAIADGTGAFHYDDASAVGLPTRFYRAAYP